MSTEKKVRLILLPLGLLAIASTYVFTRTTFISPDAVDFFRGFGLSVIIFALLFQAKWKSKP